MPRKRPPPPFELAAPAPAGVTAPPQLPLGIAHGVQVVLEGTDFVAVEAAAAEMKARFGPRFAVTDRRPAHRGTVLRITGALAVSPADALDAGAG